MQLMSPEGSAFTVRTQETLQDQTHLVHVKPVQLISPAGSDVTVRTQVSYRTLMHWSSRLNPEILNKRRRENLWGSDQGLVKTQQTNKDLKR